MPEKYFYNVVASTALDLHSATFMTLLIINNMIDNRSFN